jgi:uncharacterized repeat protein (TIGR04042 family)
MSFVVRWPDGREDHCYSPSLIVRDYLQVGSHYSVIDFVQRSRTMLNIASERVRAKRGYFCTAALDQLDELERRAASYHPSSIVTVVAFDLPGPARSA